MSSRIPPAEISARCAFGIFTHVRNQVATLVCLLFIADRLKPYVAGVPGRNWSTLEALANQSFSVETQWNLAGVQSTFARVENSALQIIDAKVSLLL